MKTPLTDEQSLIADARIAEMPEHDRGSAKEARAWARRRLREEYVVALMLGAFAEDQIAPVAVLGTEADLLAAHRVAMAGAGKCPEAIGDLARGSSLAGARVDGDWAGRSCWCAWRRATLLVLERDEWIAAVPGLLWTWNDGGSLDGCALAIALDSLAGIWETTAYSGEDWEGIVRRNLAQGPKLVRQRAWEWIIDLAPEWIDWVAAVVWRGDVEREAKAMRPTASLERLTAWARRVMDEELVPGGGRLAREFPGDLWLPELPLTMKFWDRGGHRSGVAWAAAGTLVLLVRERVDGWRITAREMAGVLDEPARRAVWVRVARLARNVGEVRLLGAAWLGSEEEATSPARIAEYREWLARWKQKFIRESKAC